MIHILLGPFRGGGFSSLWLGPASTERVCLPSHRLVGELAHPIELLLHLVFSALTPTGGNIPAYFSQCNGPCSTEAQRKIQSPIFSFLHASSCQRRERIPRLHIFKWYFFCIYICPTACAGMLDQRTAGTLRQRATAVTSSGCAAMQCGKWSQASLLMNKESTLAGSHWAWGLIRWAFIILIRV